MSGKWILAKSLHECSPPDPDESAKTYAKGSIWQCDCGREFTLSFSQCDGYFFVRSYADNFTKRTTQ